MTVAFTGRIKRGQVRMDMQEAFGVHLAALEGRVVEVIVQEPGERRTLGQNAFYHVVIHLISDYTGYTERQVHSLMKLNLLPLGVTSTARLSRPRFARYVDDVTMWAEGWLGIRIPPRDKIVTEAA